MRCRARSGVVRSVGAKAGPAPSAAGVLMGDSHPFILYWYNYLIMSVHYQITGASASEIAASVEVGVRDGHLRPGRTLPAVRRLAADLGVAAGTVAAAYRRLRERGVVE